MGRMKMVMAIAGTMAMLAGLVPDVDAASVRVRCEKRMHPLRSKISVDARGLAAGAYTARVASGAKTAVSGSEAAVGGEAEFDFGSNRADIAAGATPIGAGFIGTEVRGEVLNAQGAVVASSTVACRVR